MKNKILIVDDDHRINELLMDIFEMEGYEVFSADDGNKAITTLDSDRDIDLMILDLMMPHIDGWDVLEYVKEHYSTSVILLTALGDEATEIKGLRKGADDYVSKPFSRAVLLERAKRLLKARQKNSSILTAKDLEMNCEQHKVFISGEELQLTLKEYQLLYFFLNNKNMALTRNQIIDYVWGADFDGDDRLVDGQVKLLRKSLGELGNVIRTIRGVGYSFEDQGDEK